MEEREKFCDDWYHTEKTINETMLDEPEFNSCYIHQKAGSVTIVREKRTVAEGMFNIQIFRKSPITKRLGNLQQGQETFRFDT